MEKPFEFSASGDSFSISPETLCTRNTLNESYTISKDCNEDKTLTVICKEKSECRNSLNMTYPKCFESITDLSECKNMPFADLGTKQVSASPERKLEIGDNIEEYYDSDESLGLLPDLLEDLTCDSFIFKDNLNKDLITTGNISDKLIGNFKDCLNYDVKYNCEEFLSPISNKINISDTQAESPVYHDQCMPKHASTPKQEISNVIDEEIASPQNISDFLNEIAQDHKEENDCLNKTTIIETGLNSIITNIPTSTCLNFDENINSQQNILNTTCNITKQINNEEMSLNKTFESLPVLTDKYVLPSIIYDSEQFKISKSNILDNTFELHHSAEFDPSLGKENILNLTCHLDRESDTIGTVCGDFSENPKDCTRDILNTTVSYPSVHVETQLSKNKFDINVDQSNFPARTGDILNTTYENIEESLNYDANSEKLKCITNLERNKFLQLGTKTVIKNRRTLSFSVKNVGPEKLEFKSKISEFDRNKNIRKSFGCFEKTATRSNLTKQSNRISIASNTCSVTKVPEIKKNLSFPENLPKHDGNIDKYSLIYEKNDGNMNSSYLKNKTVKYMPLKLSDRKSKTESVSQIKPKSSQLSNTFISSHPISDVDKTVKCSSKFSNDKSEDIKLVSKVNLKDSQESVLNTTINLSPPVTDAFKTVIKKPRKSMQINNAIETCLGSREDIKSVIPSIQKRGTTKVPQMKGKEMTQEFNEDKTLTSSNITGSKKSNSMEEKKISRSSLSSVGACTQITSFHPSSDVDKTVKCSSKFSNDKSEDIKLVSKVNLKDSQESVLNTTINLSPPVTDAFKTVIKKPRKSMQINNAIETCLGSREDIKSVIPSIKKRGTTKVPQMKGKEMTQEFNEDKTLTSSNITGSKKSNSMEEKKISSLPQRTLSQKTRFQSSSQSSSNIAKPQTTAGIKPPTTSRKSFFTLTKPLNEGTELAGKAVSNDTIPSKKNKEQDTKSIKPPTTSRKSFFTLTKPSNEGTELAGKATLKDTVPSKKNKEQNTETGKKFHSKIPSISHFLTRKN